MPETAKLSKAFYDRLGEDVANEVVSLLNQIDASHRRELHDAFDANFARFEAKLDLRFAQSEAKLDLRFAQSEARMEERLGRLRGDLMSEITAIRIELAGVNARVDTKVDRGDFEAALRKQTWLVVGALATIFVGTAIPLIGLWLK
jgi:hypothetical protein